MLCICGKFDLKLCTYYLHKIIFISSSLRDKGGSQRSYAIQAFHVVLFLLSETASLVNLLYFEKGDVTFYFQFFHLIWLIYEQ
jgi:hypothetical protein